MEKLKIGEYEICPIPTGQFALDGGAMFGTVPKVLWEKAIPADDKNRIPMEARALLLKSSTANILIDCGNGGHFIEKYGEKLGTKFAQMYAVEEGGTSLTSSLAKYGLEPKDITHVILTHLHFDHAGGGVSAQNGKLVPTFPKAKYFLQKANLDTATHPNIREKASYFPANYEPLQNAHILTILNGDQEEILPGISVYVSNGHTLGQQIVKVTGLGKSLLYCGDLVPTSAHVRLAWIMGYDLNPLLLIEEKAKFLGKAADDGWYLFFEHDPTSAIAKVARAGMDFKCLVD